VERGIKKKKSKTKIKAKKKIPKKNKIYIGL